MGNACSCVSKNKEPIGETNQTIKKEENGNQVNEEIKKEVAPEQNAEVKAAPPTKDIYPEPPEDFKPEIIESVGKDVIPADDEIPDSENYHIPTKQLDDLAMELVKHNFPSFNSLVYHLIYKRSDGAECDDFQKVCALFTWLTTKNLHELKNNSTDIDPDSPEGVLLGITNGKTAYAQVFQMLCRYAGLHCKLIRGYAKGVDYKPGMKLGGGKEAQHAWNAVKIDKTWYLFDCHWAARRLMGKTISTDRIKYDLDLFYFMTNPVQLRYTHFPFEEDWQLVKKRISLEDFENLTLIKPTFFKYNLELFSHNQAVLDVQNKLVLKIVIPKDYIDRICLTFTLTLEGLGEIYEGSNLTRYGMQETSKSTGLCTLNFRFPKSGTYKLLLYAREFGDQVFGGICEYRINCKLPEKEGQDGNDKTTEESKVKPYPPTQQPSYGKTEMAARYNLKCQLEDVSSLRVSDGEFEVSFTKEDHNREDFPRLMARLKSSYHDDAKLTGRILQRSTYHADNKIDKFVVLAFLPDAGEYALEIYANNPDNEGSSFFLVWQLLVSTEKGTELPQGLADINPGAAIGAQPQFQELQLQCASHSDPYITVKHASHKDTGNDSDLELEKSDLSIHIGLPESQDVKVIGQLVDVSSDKEEVECSDYLLHQNILSSDGKLTKAVFQLRFSKGGSFYKLHVYAALSNNETETLPMVFTYLINAPLRLGSTDTPYYGSQQGKYPYQLSQWKEKCRLFEPINRDIKMEADVDKTVNFKIQVPTAFHVAVVIAGKEWTQLSKTDDKLSIWSGEVKLESTVPNGSKVAICVCYSSTITSYNTILEYYTCN